MKREFSLQCALKARSKRRKRKSSRTLSLPSSFYQSFRLLGPPGYGPVGRTEGRNGARSHRCAVYFSPGRASLTRRLSIGAASFLVCPDFCLFGFCCARCLVKIILGIPALYPSAG
ncbi:hypothetical protein AVEN_155093-1 [Araneus ventricosus]|uniref:Uncharacterized protein n=1 Tax=Araneus ventricosus TaxID=182803 RepID=A0A4Y2A7R5_ARAVE|nr:hypothetical protein AVEN_155093-1 [Araneus ventricosus]